jgi:hypothetical protein
VKEYIQTLEIRVRELERACESTELILRRNQDLMAENEMLKIKLASSVSLTNQAPRAMQEMPLM